MANILRVRATFIGMTTGAAVSTFYFSGSTAADAQAAADAVHDFYYEARALWPTYGGMTVEPDVAVVDTATGAQVGVLGTTTLLVGGTSNTEALPPMTQGLLRATTGTTVGGHTLRGRSYFPGPTEEFNASGGVPSASYRATIEVAATNKLLAATVPWVIFSPTYHQAGAVLTVQASPKWAVLRSRRD